MGAKQIYNSGSNSSSSGSGSDSSDSSAAQTPVSGDGGIVRSLHTFVDFGAGYKFKLSNGSMWKTCKAALGFSFAAGTTDWPGFADFTQNDPGAPSNPFWLLVRNLLKIPTKEQKDCHAPKPILLNVGEMDQPYAWYVMAFFLVSFFCFFFFAFFLDEYRCPWRFEILIVSIVLLDHYKIK